MARSLLAPKAGATVTAGQAVTFNWNDVASNFQYDIQVDDSPSFTSR